MAKLVFSLLVIFMGLGLGKLIQLLHARGIIKLHLALNEVQLILQKVVLLFFNPITVIGTIWIVRLDNPGIILFPCFGILGILLGGFWALLVSKILQKDRKQAGSLFVCGAFSNVGSIGGLICFVLLGEGGYALVAFYMLFVPMANYCIGFPIAKLYNPGFIRQGNLSNTIKKVLMDPFIIVAVASTLVGFAINLTGFQRPVFYKALNQILIPLATTLLLTSAGLTIRFSSFWKYRRECIAMAAIKFLILPAAVTSVGILLDYGKMLDGLPLKVLIILSSMPVGFLALVPPVLYDLDVDLANSCWLFTTALLAMVLLELHVIVNLI
jgi:predicted permease